MYDSNTIDLILQNADITDIIGESVKLEKEGSRYKGLCPFHDERTPSFVVYPQTNTCKCYGCGKHFNVIGYVMEKEHMTFPKTVRYLGRRYGIDVKEHEESQEEQSSRMKKEALKGCLKAVSVFYRQQFLIKNRSASCENSVSTYFLAIEKGTNVGLHFLLSLFGHSGLSRWIIYAINYISIN